MKILALDDDFVILALVESAFDEDGVEVETFDNGVDALSALEANQFDLIISDLMMPGMSGEVFFEHVKKDYPDIPFIFLTSKNDSKTIVDIMKMGADDYLLKPIDGGKLKTRSLQVVLEKQKALILKKTQIDDYLDQQDRSRIFSWKKMYGSKDTEQTDKIMHYLSRNIEQAGGFLWLEMLRSKLDKAGVEANELTLKRSMVEMIVESTEYISKILSDLNYVTNLQSESFLLEHLSLNEFISRFSEVYDNELIPVTAAYKKRISMDFRESDQKYRVDINTASMMKVLKELFFNAVKYSPKDTKIMIYFDIRSDHKGDLLEISYWNYPVKTVTKDENGDAVTGIPYEFSESVFELFYTLEKFPVRIPEEEWSQGSGLYIVKKLINKMNGEIEAKNVIMHTPERPVLFVKTTIYLPLEKIL